MDKKNKTKTGKLTKEEIESQQIYYVNPGEMQLNLRVFHLTLKGANKNVFIKSNLPGA